MRRVRTLSLWIVIGFVIGLFMLPSNLVHLISTWQ